jgi:hypothetical protein
LRIRLVCVQPCPRSGTIGCKASCPRSTNNVSFLSHKPYGCRYTVRRSEVFCKGLQRSSTKVPGSWIQGWPSRSRETFTQSLRIKSSLQRLGLRVTNRGWRRPLEGRPRFPSARVFRRASGSFTMKVAQAEWRLASASKGPSDGPSGPASLTTAQ